MTVCVTCNGTVSVLTHKLTEMNKNCMDAILKGRSTEMDENRRNEMFTMIKQLKCESTVKALTLH